jgi:DNA-binding transcriptional MerR regulator
MRATEGQNPASPPAGSRVDQKKARAAGLRMRELVAATGVAKSTILHYLNEGLLPAPVKTSRNMAYYDPGCVERLTFIRLMQSKHHLPLAAIKEVLRDLEEGRGLAPLLELNAAIFGRPDSQELLDEQSFRRATGLGPGEAEQLVAAGLLQPLQEGRFDQEDVAMGRILRRSLDLGLTPADCAYYPRLAAEIVDQEMALRRRLTADLSFEQDAALTLELTGAARALRAYVIDRVFQHRVMAMKNLKGHDDGQPPGRQP